MTFNRRGCLLLALAALGGCSRNYTPAPPSEMSVAKEALEKALNLWRSKVTPMELLATKPAITMFDEDWVADQRLMDFQLLPGEAAAGPTIRWPVRLRVVRKDNQEQTLDVVYVITTNPVIHISRQD